eukprot:2420333-Amphidinium_carterae.1
MLLIVGSRKDCHAEKTTKRKSPSVSLVPAFTANLTGKDLLPHTQQNRAWTASQELQALEVEGRWYSECKSFAEFVDTGLA